MALRSYQTPELELGQASKLASQDRWKTFAIPFNGELLAHSSGSEKLSADHRSSGQGSAQSRDQDLEIMIPQLLFSI
jgi:hypothetical protein